MNKKLHLTVMLILTVCASCFAQGELTISGLNTSPDEYWFFGYSNSSSEPNTPFVNPAAYGPVTNGTVTIVIPANLNTWTDYVFGFANSVEQHGHTGVSVNVDESFVPYVAPVFNSGSQSLSFNGSSIMAVPEPSTNSFFFLAVVLLLFTPVCKRIGHRLYRGWWERFRFCSLLSGSSEQSEITERKRLLLIRELQNGGRCIVREEVTDEILSQKADVTLQPERADRSTLEKNIE